MLRNVCVCRKVRIEWCLVEDNKRRIYTTYASSLYVKVISSEKRKWKQKINVKSVSRQHIDIKMWFISFEMCPVLSAECAKYYIHIHRISFGCCFLPYLPWFVFYIYAFADLPFQCSFSVSSKSPNSSPTYYFAARPQFVHLTSSAGYFHKNIENVQSIKWIQIAFGLL